MNRIRISRLLALLAIIGVVVVGLLNHFMPSWWERMLYPLKYRAEIGKYAGRNRLDPYLIAAVISVESGFDARSNSNAGARGLMQLLPGTARDVAANLHDSDFSPDSLYDPDTNIRYGTWYLAKLTKRYDSTVFALAAYNGGGTNMDKWLRGKETSSERDVIAKIPFKETREFVSRVTRTKEVYRRLYPDAFE